jgi:phosphoglycolate phosphatase-like HAD superfamily hydrolase
MVGDTESDVFAARANGIASAILLDGYGDKYSIEKSRPEYTINTIDALKEIMQT